MFESRISRLLLLLGAGVGLLGVGVWALEIPMNLPDWIVRVAMLKLTLTASIGLLAGGALLGRHARQRLLSDRNDDRALADGSVDSIINPRGVDTAEHVERRSDPLA